MNIFETFRYIKLQIVFNKEKVDLKKYEEVIKKLSKGESDENNQNKLST